MRHPERIDCILEKLETLWKQNPDWRLGQLIENCVGGRVTFYIEDDELEAGMDHFIRV